MVTKIKSRTTVQKNFFLHFQKIIERLMHFNSDVVFKIEQNRFRTNRSTTDRVNELVNKIINGSEQSRGQCHYICGLVKSR